MCTSFAGLRPGVTDAPVPPKLQESHWWCEDDGWSKDLARRPGWEARNWAGPVVYAVELQSLWFYLRLLQ